MIKRQLTLEELRFTCNIIASAINQEFLVYFPFKHFKEFIGNIDNYPNFELTLEINSNLEFSPNQRTTIKTKTGFLKDETIFTFSIRIRNNLKRDNRKDYETLLNSMKVIYTCLE